MKIAAAQLQSVPGDIAANTVKHLVMIDRAADMGADVVFFPELSLTGYEPALSGSLAMSLADARLDVFQATADQNELLIGLGLPLAGEQGVQIGMAWFTPGQPRQAYAKQFLHPDEEPYFVVGDSSLMLEWGGQKLAPAICYESLLDVHIGSVVAGGADIYLASVAKDLKGVRQAAVHYSDISKRRGIPVIMANSVGSCDDFVAAGLSGAWRPTCGSSIQLDQDSNGVVLFDAGSLAVHVEMML